MGPLCPPDQEGLKSRTGFSRSSTHGGPDLAGTPRVGPRQTLPLGHVSPSDEDVLADIGLASVDLAHRR